MIAAAVGATGLFWLLGHTRTAGPAAVSPVHATAAPGDAGEGRREEPLQPTTVYAHNLRLRKGPLFHVYVRWLRGLLQRTHSGVSPSFDDPDSFVLEIQKGVLRVNIGDISNYLNANLPKSAPLTNIRLRASGDGLQLRGTVHKLMPLPIELDGTLSPTPDGQIQFHVNRISVLKLPFKGLLGSFHMQLSDLVGTLGLAGVQVAGNDIFFDTERLLPPPHMHGELSSVRVATPDLEMIYGNAPIDAGQPSEWHNFFRLQGGTLEFGKLTMNPVDLTMIDASQSPWFDLDLVNYQAQLVDGYTRITGQAGLEIFLPKLRDVRSATKKSPPVTLDWLKNKHLSMPTGVPVK